MVKKVKTAIIGSNAVGKTSIILRMAEGTFNGDIGPTVGMDFSSQKRMVRGETVLVEFWDTTGQEKYRAVVSSFFKNADGLFITFDLADGGKSLNELEFWLQEAEKHVPVQVPKMILANKADLVKDIPAETVRQVEALCDKYSCSWQKVSAKADFNIKASYEELLSLAYDYVCVHRKDQRFSHISEIVIDKPSKCC